MAAANEGGGKAERRSLGVQFSRWSNEKPGSES